MKRKNFYFSVIIALKLLFLSSCIGDCTKNQSVFEAMGFDICKKKETCSTSSFIYGTVVSYYSTGCGSAEALKISAKVNVTLLSGCLYYETVCSGERVSSGLVYDYDTGAEINKTATAGKKLECRKYKAADIYETGEWWKTVPGSYQSPYESVKYFQSEIIYDSDEKRIGIIPLTNYKSGDILYCVSLKEGNYNHSQKIEIK